jgi:putative aldouronate transport system substrate-binding protein
MNKYSRILMWFNDMNTNLDNWLTAQYGVKGEDWTYDENTKILKYGLSPATKEANEKEDWAPLGLGYLFISDYIDLAKAKDAEGYAFADKVSKFTDNYADPIANAALQSRAKYDVDLVKLTKTAYTEMITGKKPIDQYFDQYVKDWEAAGGTEVIQEANDWFAKNAN